MEPAFFAYTYPRPEGIEQAQVKPAAAYWSVELGEFFLPYEAVRTAADPRQALLDFSRVDLSSRRRSRRLGLSFGDRRGTQFGSMLWLWWKTFSGS